MNTYEKVFFLGISSYANGLLFPKELEKNEYCPSILIIASESKHINSSYALKICSESSTYETQLLIYEKKLGKSTIKEELIHFEIIKSKLEYKGSSELLKAQNINLFEVRPIQIGKLEELAINKDTFIVGYTP